MILLLQWYQVLHESLPFPDLDHRTRLEAQKTLWVIHRNSSSKGQTWAENLKKKNPELMNLESISIKKFEILIVNSTFLNYHWVSI